MKIIDCKEYDLKGAEQVITLCAEGTGSTVTGVTYVQVISDGAVTLKGYIDGVNAVDVTPINAISYATGPITKAGIYMVATEAYTKLGITGQGKVIVKRLY